MIEQAYSFNTLEECLRNLILIEKKLTLWKERYIGSDFTTEVVLMPKKFKLKVKIILNARKARVTDKSN